EPPIAPEIVESQVAEPPIAASQVTEPPIAASQAAGSPADPSGPGPQRLALPPASEPPRCAPMRARSRASPAPARTSARARPRIRACIICTNFSSEDPQKITLDFLARSFHIYLAFTKTLSAN